MPGFTKKIAVLALVAATACVEGNPSLSPPLDQFYFPTGIGLRKLPDGRSVLLVVSSNFDLRYALYGGGTVIAIDPDAAQDSLPGCSKNCGTGIAQLGAVIIGTFGGEVGIADEANCPQLFPGVLQPGTAKVFVSSRSDTTLYRIDMASDGSLDCGPDCPFVMDSGTFDPYGATVVCLDTGDQKASLFVTQERSAQDLARLTQMDLRASATNGRTLHDFTATAAGVLVSPTYTSAYQKLGQVRRMFVTTRFGVTLTTQLYWLDLGGAASTSNVAVDLVDARHIVNIYRVVPGSITGDIAISNDQTRAYVPLQLYDANLALRTGQYTVLSAALATFDIRPTFSGEPAFALLRLVPIGTGTGQARVLPPRTDALGNPKRDLVVATTSADGTLVIYDDDLGAVVRVIGTDTTTGFPQLGLQPFGLAVEQRQAAACLLPGLASPSCDRIYVGSFRDGWVNVVELDPALPGGADIVKRIGPPQIGAP